MSKRELHLKVSQVESLELSVELSSDAGDEDRTILNQVVIDHPPEAGSGEPTISAGTLVASGHYVGDPLRRIWAIVARSGSLFPTPWDCTSVEGLVNNVSSGWSFAGVPGTISGTNNVLQVWGAFSGDVTVRGAQRPFSCSGLVGVTVDAPAAGLIEGLVPSACAHREGLPPLLVLTVNKSVGNAIQSTTVELVWNGQCWLGETQDAAGGVIPWELRLTSPRRACRPGDFKVSCGNSDPQSPSTLNCNPFQLVWNDDKSRQISPLTAKTFTDGQIEITVSE